MFQINFFRRPVALLPAALALTLFTACDKDDANQPSPAAPAALPVRTVSNLAAGLTTPDGAAGLPTLASHYTFYSLAEQKAIPVSDSASTRWDIALKGTTILINGGSSGPGAGGAQVFTGLFDDLATAPETGFATDSPTARAIPTGSGNGWYTYNPMTNIISPVAGKVLLIRTAAGRLAKVEVVSYYRNAPAMPAPSDASRYYTFRYVYQPDGSRNLR